MGYLDYVVYRGGDDRHNDYGFHQERCHHFDFDLLLRRHQGSHH
jgi:hypothetical protein